MAYKCLIFFSNFKLFVLLDSALPRSKNIINVYNHIVSRKQNSLNILRITLEITLLCALHCKTNDYEIF